MPLISVFHDGIHYHWMKNYLALATNWVNLFSVSNTVVLKLPTGGNKIFVCWFGCNTTSCRYVASVGLGVRVLSSYRGAKEPSISAGRLCHTDTNMAVNQDSGLLLQVVNVNLSDLGHLKTERDTDGENTILTELLLQHWKHNHWSNTGSKAAATAT